MKLFIVASAFLVALSLQTVLGEYGGKAYMKCRNGEPVSPTLRIEMWPLLNNLTYIIRPDGVAEFNNAEGPPPQPINKLGIRFHYSCGVRYDSWTVVTGGFKDRMFVQPALD